MDRVRGLALSTLAVVGCFNPTVSTEEKEEGTTSSTSGGGSGAPSGGGPAPTAETGGSDNTSADFEGTTTSEATGGQASQGTEDVQCRDGRSCVSPPEGGWQGPALVVTDSTVPSCPEAFPDTVRTVFSDLQAPPAECDCSCGAAQGATCAPYELTYFAPTDTECDSPLGSFEVDTVPLFDCTLPIGIDTDQRWQLLGGDVLGSCEPTAASDVEEATWAQTSAVCAGAFENCVGGICAPATSASEGQLCVWMEGETACPAGSDFSERNLHYSDFSESRDCSECSCELEGKCGGEVFLNAQFGCSGTTGLEVYGMSVPGNGDKCSLITDSPIEAARAQSVSVDPSCLPSGGEPVGEASPTSPLTFCCVP